MNLRPAAIAFAAVTFLPAAARAQAASRVPIETPSALDSRRFKTFYLRPTNGRADDQLRRNHSVQYTSEPEWPWDRLRREATGLYESYVDLVAGEWTSLKIVVAKDRADLYVNGASQPTLVVTDLKSPDRTGGIALWIGRGTVGYFANLRVTRGGRVARRHEAAKDVRVSSGCENHAANPLLHESW